MSINVAAKLKIYSCVYCREVRLYSLFFDLVICVLVHGTQMYEHRVYNCNYVYSSQGRTGEQYSIVLFYNPHTTYTCWPLNELTACAWISASFELIPKECLYASGLIHSCLRVKQLVQWKTEYPTILSPAITPGNQTQPVPYGLRECCSFRFLIIHWKPGHVVILFI